MKAKATDKQNTKSARLGEFKLIDSSLIDYAGRTTVTKYYKCSKEVSR